MDKKDPIRPQPGPQEQALSSRADVIFTGGAAGGGKMLAIDTPIPTPFGWKKMSDIVTGDTLFGEDGLQTTVINAHPIDYSPVSYRMVFDDGSSVCACENHLWHTFNAKDLSELSKRTEEWRARRREDRPSRSKKNRSKEFIEMMTKRNRETKHSYLPAPTGSIVSTAHISKTLLTKRGRRNHATAVSKPLFLSRKEYAIPPYILGVWLGDGTRSNGNIMKYEKDRKHFVDKFKNYGYDCKVYKDNQTVRVIGLLKHLKKLGLFGIPIGAKRIPQEYLRGDHDQRLALLQGLMDTDGTVDRISGKPSFTNTNKDIVDGIYELIVSLGWKASVTNGRAKLYGKDYGPVWDVYFMPSEYVFSIERKRTLQKLATRRTNKFRYIVSCSRIEPVPMRCITVSSNTGMYLCGKAMIPTHNTFSMLLAPLINIDDPNFNAIFFRRTYPELIAGGGIWDTSKKIYTRFNATPNESKLTWEFPSGAKIKFSHLQYDNDVHKHQSAAYCLIGFDELPQFTMYQFFYLLSRNRAPTGYSKSCWCIGAGNAEPGWVANLISWWWNQDTGYAIKGRSGIVRYFTRKDDSIVWVDKDRCDARGNKPKSLTFIPAYLDDNKILMANDPRYEANLLAQDLVTRERLFYGNWLISYSGGVFRKEWFQPIKAADVPKGLKAVRYWDFAATEAKEGTDPDWTAGCKLGTDGRDYYILDVARFRETPGATKHKMKEKARHFDGYETTIAWEEEKGSAGKFNTHDLCGFFLGYVTYPDPVTGDKVERAKPIAAAAEHGHVFMVEGLWNTAFLSEISQFGSGKGHKDQVDALSGACKILSSVQCVLTEYSATSNVEAFTINWDKPPEYMLSYGSFFYESGKLYTISAVWEKIAGCLWVYGAKMYDTVVPDLIAIETVRTMRLKRVQTKLVGNDLIFTEDGGRTVSTALNGSLRKHGAMTSIVSPALYDLRGAIVYFNTLCFEGNVTISRELVNLSAQLSGWNYENGEPAKRYGYCFAMMHMVSELRRNLVEERRAPKIPDYRPVEEKKPEMQSYQVA